VVLASYGLLLLLRLYVAPWSVVPLLCFSWGVWHAHWRSHIWLCFLLLFYFLANVNGLASQVTPALVAECLLLVTLFVSSLLFCRWTRSVPHAVA